MVDEAGIRPSSTIRPWAGQVVLFLLQPGIRKLGLDFEVHFP